MRGDCSGIGSSRSTLLWEQKLTESAAGVVSALALAAGLSTHSAAAAEAAQCCCKLPAGYCKQPA
jgi:hypothetical protein